MNCKNISKNKIIMKFSFQIPSRIQNISFLHILLLNKLNKQTKIARITF